MIQRILGQTMWLTHPYLRVFAVYRLHSLPLGPFGLHQYMRLRSGSSASASSRKRGGKWGTCDNLSNIPLPRAHCRAGTDIGHVWRVWVMIRLEASGAAVLDWVSFLLWFHFCAKLLCNWLFQLFWVFLKPGCQDKTLWPIMVFALMLKWIGWSFRGPWLF